MRYTYGTSKEAVKRLEEISNFFNPLTSKFIKEYINENKKMIDMLIMLGVRSVMKFNIIGKGDKDE